MEWQNPNKQQDLADKLAQFEMLDITQAVSDLATELYRFDKFEAEQNKEQRNFEKRKFDMFHYATANVNGLEILSHDGDLDKIQQLHKRMQEVE